MPLRTKKAAADVLITIILAALATHSNAQERPRWTNPTLKERGLSSEQYQAIGKGHLAECQSRATQISQQTYPPVSIQPDPFSERRQQARRTDHHRATPPDLC